MPNPGETARTNPAPTPDQPPTVETVKTTKDRLAALKTQIEGKRANERTPEQQRVLDDLIARSGALIAEMAALETPGVPFDAVKAAEVMQRATALLQQMTAKMKPAEATGFVGGLNRFMEEFKKVGEQLGGFGSEQLEQFADFFKLLGMNTFAEIVRKLSGSPKARLKTIEDTVKNMGLTFTPEASEGATSVTLAKVTAQYNAIRTQMTRKGNALNATVGMQTEGATILAEANAYKIGAYVTAALANRGNDAMITLPKIETFGQAILRQATTDADAAVNAQRAAPVPVTPAPATTPAPAANPAPPANGAPPATPTR